MKTATRYLAGFTVITVLALSIVSCNKEEPVPAPVVQSITASVDGYDAAFSITASDATSYAWDFGDGESSTEQNPLHTYAQSGDYTATCTVTGEGGSANGTVDVTIAASQLEMLTGGPAMANGKTWKFSSTSSEKDGIYYANAEMGYQDPIPSGILGLIGLASEYEDEFTFKYDMTYTHNPVNDSVVTDIIYAMLNQIEFRQSAEDVIVLCPFTPEAATFTYTEGADFTLEVVPDDDYPETTEEITWSGHEAVLEIEGGTEFVGLQDFTRKYIVFGITPDKLELGIFITAISSGSKIGTPSHILRMTFVPAE